MLTDVPGDGRGSDGAVPGHVAAVLRDEPDVSTVRGFYAWCEELGVETATVSLPGAVDRRRYEEGVDGLEPPVCVVESASSSPDAAPRVLSYVGGREGVVGALRDLARGVDEGDVSPDGVDAEAVEERLAVPGEPDLVVETTDASLTDALVWQTVYSELCHVEELDRESLRDCVEDYAERERRYGR